MIQRIAEFAFVCCVLAGVVVTTGHISPLVKAQGELYTESSLKETSPSTTMQAQGIEPGRFIRFNDGRLACVISWECSDGNCTFTFLMSPSYDYEIMTTEELVVRAAEALPFTSELFKEFLLQPHSPA